MVKCALRLVSMEDLWLVPFISVCHGQLGLSKLPLPRTHPPRLFDWPPGLETRVGHAGAARRSEIAARLDALAPVSQLAFSAFAKLVANEG